MADLLDAAREVDGYCRRHNWRYCIIGGMALLRWGEQRMTKDVDITPNAISALKPALVRTVRRQCADVAFLVTEPGQQRAPL